MTYLVERLAELKPGLRITAVEAGRSIFDRDNRVTYHRRALEYGRGTEPAPFPAPRIETQSACEAARLVLQQAGVRPLDAVDRRFVESVVLDRCVGGRAAHPPHPPDARSAPGEPGRSSTGGGGA